MAITSGLSSDLIEADDIDIILPEYGESEPVALSETAERALRTEINGGAEREGDRIGIKYQRDGRAKLKAKQYVGVVSLPEGPTIEIQPKATGTNLLYLLRYSHGVETFTAPQPTQLREGTTFIDALAAMFESELSRVIDQGVASGYRQRDDTERHLRGRLDIHRQIQRQGPKPTFFECTYDEITQDTIVNQAILYATSILTGLTRDRSISQALYQHQQLLRRRVTLRPVPPIELEQIQLNRLNAYYSDLLRLTELVIQNINISNLQIGTRASFGLLVNMNTVFERAVERACKRVIRHRNDWRVVGQDAAQSIIQGGKHTVSIKPDITIYDQDDNVRLVADAKWKIGPPSNADFYQIASYQLALNSPGCLIYPQQNDEIESSSRVASRYDLSLTELPTSSPASTFDGFRSNIETSLEERITQHIF